MEDPILEIIPSDVIVAQSSVQLKCKVITNMNVTYDWFKDDVLWKNTNESVYTIESIGRDASGSYTCAVTSTQNGERVSSDAIPLIVNCKLFLFGIRKVSLMFRRMFYV